MADLIAHLQQANHNAECARYLLANKQDARDWAITAAFYCAVHLIEACFTSVHSIGHTEEALDRRGGEDPHSYRQRKILELASPAYNSYKKLRNASYHVRYLPATAPGGSRFALDYYDVPSATQFLERDLPKVWSELETAFNVKLH